MRLPLRHFSTLLIFTVLFTTVQSFSQSQATTGVIQGRVEDASGAVVAGAKVVAKNTETNFSRDMTTGGDGRFVFLAMPPGPYTVTVTPGSGGFAVLEQSNVNLTVGQSITLTLQMKVAQGSEKIVVTDTPLLDPTKTESSSTITQQAISATPVLGRKFEDLLTLTPGVSVSQGPDGDEINFNGQRGIFNNISLDGGDYNNGFFGEQMGGQRAAVDISLDAIGEFQVVASGATAEFGRTAGGVVNVITKSGTNDLHGTASYYQRLKALTSDASDGKPIDGFHREQFGGTIGGPIKKDKQFFFIAYEQILSDFTRKNLGEQLGSTPCPVAHPSVLNPADVPRLQPVSAGGNPDCQRLALLDFYAAAPFNLNEGAPIKHPVHNSSILGKWDYVINSANKLGVSYSFDYSKNENQTFDVNTYGASANGTEGPSKINLLNVNMFTTVSSTQLNEFHFTYGRENRPRQANGDLNPDTGIGSDFGTSPNDAFAFRFGNPFFLQPNVDEIFWRAQFRDNYSIVSGRHTFKLGGEWMHSLNSQVFRGFFQGRYIFGSVLGFLHYAKPASTGFGFGPNTGQCPNGTFTDLTAPTCVGAFSPLFLYLQGANLNGPATDATGFSKISNDDFALFAQDKWQITRNFTLNYGLRWEAQTFPDPVIPPSQTAYAPFLNTALFPSDGTLHNQWKQFQPRLGFSWDLTGRGKSVLRASAGIYNAHQNMLTQVGSITTNGVQQQTIAGVTPTYPGTVASFPVLPPGTFPLFSGVRAFDKNYHNPRIYTVNTQFEQEVMPNLSVYADFTWTKGVYLTNFLNLNRGDRGALFSPQLGDVFLTTSRSNSLYRGLTIGARKRLSNRFQFDANYVYSSDWDTDSNERDPFNDFSGPATPAQPYVARLDYAHSNRHIPHKFNMYTTAYMPWGFEGSIRFQARSSQPNAIPRTATTARNVGEKGNEYSSLDWRLSRPIKFTERYQLIPMVEMFNTLNADNNVNTLSAPPLFDFNGFLRVGVGDPRQVQLSVKFKF